MEKLVVGRREDLFFGLYPMFEGKLDVGAPEDDFGGGGGGGGGTHCLVSALLGIFRKMLYAGRLIIDSGVKKKCR